jgi:anti-sigma-K factor RskA
MITDDQQEEASLYTLGLLNEPELTKFIDSLARNAALRALTDSITETVSLLTFTVTQISPPATLRAKIMAAAGEQIRPVAAPMTEPAQVIRFPLLRFAPWAVAAGLALATTWLTTQNFSLRNENADLRSEAQLANVAYKMAQNQVAERSLLAEQMISNLGQKLQRSEDLARLKVTALASLAGNTAEAKVIAVWDPEQQAGLLTMDRLPAIGENQDYQIWIVDPAYKNPVNGGVFHISDSAKLQPVSFKPDEPITQAAAFAISLEKKGGVAKAENTIVLLGQ